MLIDVEVVVVAEMMWLNIVKRTGNSQSVHYFVCCSACGGEVDECELYMCAGRLHEQY